MNILIVTAMDHSGAGYALARAVNEHTEHEARQVAFRPSYLEYPVDILTPSRADVLELVKGADVVNIHDGDFYLVPEYAPERPVVTTYHGSTYRVRWPWYNANDRANGSLPTALCLDLALYGPHWLPRPVPDLSEMRTERGNGVLRVAHAPTNRGIKDTETVLAALDGLEGIELELIEGVSNAECIRRKAACDVLIEEFKLGYGTNAMECWAMGMPVIADAWPGIKSYMMDKLGRLPFLETPLTELREWVEQLRDDAGLYGLAARQGRDYWNEYHRPAVAAKRFVEYCQQAIGGG